MTTKTKTVKKKALRHNEYYGTQACYDNLYSLGKLENNTYKFYNLMSEIENPNNILLAFRNIKRNKGSKTAGVNKTTILDTAEQSPERFVKCVQARFRNYKPNPIKRVEIPKPNGKMRPLGIPTIEDRIIQQCIKQVLEPILEAKFYQHSYGFRPDRGTNHAIAYMENLAFKGYHYAVDIDIEGFFDNVNHGKLMKQLWTLGIRDKRLLTIISRMLKAEIKGIGVPNKGTPQGGILSPLLANVVLNELDWWIASQWDNMPTKHIYSRSDSKARALRKTNLKDIKIVRYADDFKIMCKDPKTAQKIFIATKMWLQERLSLNISPEKSKITNLRKNYSEFLGFKLRLKKGNANKYTNRSHMSDKAKEKTIRTLKDKIIKMVKNPTRNNVNKYNATVLNLQDYYSKATLVSQDFKDIAYKVRKSLYNRTKSIRAETGTIGQTYLKFYSEYSYKKLFIANTILFPIAAVKFKSAKSFSQEKCRYTIAGRDKLHKCLEMDIRILQYIMQNPVQGQSIEYNDNRISLYAGQQGICGISGQILRIGYMEAHHKIPKWLGGTDEYSNLTFVTYDVHKLIHATADETIAEYLEKVELDTKGLKRLNELRALVGNNVILTELY